MSTEQIIKDLEESIQKIEAFYDGMNIPKELRSSENKKALALIKELQAHNENLKKENKYLRESLADEREHKEDMEGKDGHQEETRSLP
jgi:hypothetical protein